MLLLSLFYPQNFGFVIFNSSEPVEQILSNRVSTLTHIAKNSIEKVCSAFKPAPPPTLSSNFLPPPPFLSLFQIRIVLLPLPLTLSSLFLSPCPLPSLFFSSCFSLSVLFMGHTFSLSSLPDLLDMFQLRFKMCFFIIVCRSHPKMF